MKNIGNITLAAWVVTFLLGYFGLGAWLYEVMEGMDRSMVPLAPSIAFAIAVVTSIVLTVMWARNLGSDAPAEDKPSGRRKFSVGWSRCYRRGSWWDGGGSCKALSLVAVHSTNDE